MPWPDRRAVVVPIDESEASVAAVREAMSLVASPAHLHVVHVVPGQKTHAEIAQASVEAEKRLASSLQAEVQVTVRSGEAGDEIVRFAEEIGGDLIVIPSHGRSGVSRLFLGSVTDRVLRSAPCPVLVLRR